MMHRRRYFISGSLVIAPKQAMRLAVDAVGKVEGVRAAVVPAAPESQGPETARRISRTGGDRVQAMPLIPDAATIQKRDFYGMGQDERGKRTKFLPQKH